MYCQLYSKTQANMWDTFWGNISKNFANWILNQQYLPGKYVKIKRKPSE